MSKIRITLLAIIASSGSARADDWPQWMGPNRDGRWNEAGVVRTLPTGGPKVLWRTPIRNGFSGPAVVGDRVCVTDYETSGVTTGDPGARSSLNGRERVLCLDAKTGRELWKHDYDCPYKISYPAGPRCTPTVSGGKVYTLGAEGHLYCFDAANGSVHWSKSLKDEYKIPAPMWGFTGHPLVDGQKLICLVGGDGTTLVAFDKDTGKEIWRSLSSREPGYSSPSIITAGGTRQLLIWTPESIHSLDPETGKPYWSIELEPQYGMSIMAPRKSGDFLFAGGIGWKSALLKLAKDKPAAELVWYGKKDTSVYPVNSTPIIEDGVMYGVDQPGQLRAVRVATGERLWETTSPTTGEKPASSGTAFLVKNRDRWFIFNERGELVIAKLTPEKYEEVSRAKLLEPTGDCFGRPVVWSHPAFAGRCMFARNDKEIICVSLAE
jgi:outer membrane protein assembly factor BamB